MRFDWTKILTNLMHVGLVFASAYAVTDPSMAWAVPAFQAIGGFSPGANLVPSPKTPAPPVPPLSS